MNLMIQKTVESVHALGNLGISMAESLLSWYCKAVLPFKPFTGESTLCLLLVMRGRFLTGKTRETFLFHSGLEKAKLLQSTGY